MSASKQALRSRMRSVNSTRKITNAMQMIANAKLVKQRNKMEANREYAQRLQDVVNEIVSSNQDVDCALIRPKKTGSTAVYTILFCSDLGLCGGYNQNMKKLAITSLHTEDPLVIIGSSLYNEMVEAGFKPVNEQTISSDHLTFLELKGYVETGIEAYKNGEVDQVQVIYTKFVNTMSFVPETDVLLPCEVEQNDANKVHQETLFEPDPETILNSLIPQMVEDVAYADWMETTTAEQGSRRVAMKTATDNADELSQTLLLEYNKARQAAITQEITEIVGGSNAV